MNYNILENFLEQSLCEKLIIDAKTFSFNDHVPVLNNRMILPSSSISFLNLINKSSAWQNLHDNLNSDNFLLQLLSLLNIENKDFEITNFFFNKNPNFFLKKYKTLNTKKISTIGNLNLIFYFFFKFFRFLNRKIKYSLTKKNYVELLYDYSICPNGYHREVHRDSDSRTIVFLIYLNDLDNKGLGGNLNLYRYKKKQKLIPSQPRLEECELILSIPPKAGTLVTFLNSHDSLHSVSEMENFTDSRHFLYGSFTLLSKRNKYLKNSKDKLKTNFTIFD